MIYIFYRTAVAALLLAFISSLIHFRLHPLHLKIFSILLGVDFVNEFVASNGVGLLHGILSITNNSPNYNTFVLVQFMTYAFYFFSIIKFEWFRKIAIGFMWVFPLIWIFSVIFVFGIINWNSYIHVTGSTFTIIACAVFFYQLYISDETASLSKNTEFWIASALFIFYSCNLPYTGTLNYLNHTYPLVAQQLSIVLVILNIVMYSIIIYAFLCRQIKTMKSL